MTHVRLKNGLTSISRQQTSASFRSFSLGTMLLLLPLLLLLRANPKYRLGRCLTASAAGLTRSVCVLIAEADELSAAVERFPEGLRGGSCWARRPSIFLKLLFLHQSLVFYLLAGLVCLHLTFAPWKTGIRLGNHKITVIKTLIWS